MLTLDYLTKFHPIFNKHGLYVNVTFKMPLSHDHHFTFFFQVNLLGWEIHLERLTCLTPPSSSLPTLRSPTWSSWPPQPSCWPLSSTHLLRVGAETASLAVMRRLRGAMKLYLLLSAPCAVSSGSSIASSVGGMVRWMDINYINYINAFIIFWLWKIKGF